MDIGNTKLLRFYEAGKILELDPTHPRSIHYSQHLAETTSTSIASSPSGIRGFVPPGQMKFIKKPGQNAPGIRVT
jgi:hypothetical protein